MRQIILDTETTGLNPDEGHKLVEVAAVEVINRQLTGKNIHLYVNPGRESDPEALAIHGLTTDFLQDYPIFEEIAHQVVDFVSDAELIIHNAPFDTKFLNAELTACGYNTIDTYSAKITDSLVYARELFPGRRNSLDALCERFGISNEHRVLHGALLDSELLAQVWLAMTRGQDSLLMDFAGDEVNTTDQINIQGDVLNNLPVLLAKPEEVALHEEYLSSLDNLSKNNTVWRKFN